MNWTLARAGTNRNVIPADATAMADVRVLRVADYDGIEQKMRDRIRKQLIPDTTAEMTFERRRPPLEVTAASRALAARAQGIYAEVGGALSVRVIAEGGAPTPPSQRFCSHSNDAEYVDLDSIEPRLYLLPRMISDVSQGKTDRIPQSAVAPPDIFAIAPGAAGAMNATGLRHHMGGSRRCRVIAGRSAVPAGSGASRRHVVPGRPPPRGSCLSCDNRTSISRPMA
jgi:metal-dependent amidase/aminoacylase/carboxypeptidase family protein